MTPKILYSIHAESEDDVTPEGDFASGDDAADAALCVEIRKRADSGDTWAWCSVEVIARIEGEGMDFAGHAYLGACSYESEADFKADAYYADMCAEAREDLLNNLQSAVARGGGAKTLLRALTKSGK